MTFFVWALFVVSMAATLVAGILLLAGDARLKAQRSLGLFLIACASWSTFSVLQSYGWSMTISEILVRLTFVASLAMAYTLYRFTEVFARVHRPVLDRILQAFVVLASGLCLTPYVVSGVILRDGATIPERRPGYLLVLVLLVTLLTIGLVTITRYYRSLQTSRVKLRAQLIVIGLVAGVLIGVLTNIILPNVAPELHASRLAWVPSAVWMVTLVYAVVRHGFLDIRLALVRGGGFILSAAVAAALYCVAVLASSYWLGILTNLDVQDIVLNSILIVVIAALFPLLKQFFDRFTHAVFGRGNYSRSGLYARLTDRLVRVDDIDALRQALEEVIGRTLKPSVIGVCMVDDEAAGDADNLRLRAEEREVLVQQFVDEDKEYLEFDPYDKPSPTTRVARRLGLALVFPLRRGDEVVALFCLGRLEGRVYNTIDREFLQTVADELSITVEKLLSVEQIKGFNAGLQREVARATRKLRESNRRLVEMDATKDEFVSMASHQLRTPLTSVKGYISMVLEGDAGDISPTQRKLLEEAFTSSERMVHLIGDFLNVSRLQTGKFIIDPHASDLAKVVAQEVEGTRQIAATHDIKLVYKQPKVFPQLYLDEGKIRQVIMNFIDNAIYYSPESKSITVKLSIEDGDAVLRVIDQGMGVPQDEQAKLFSKFFRAANARKQRPDGTGIGLYLAKKVIDGHHGKPVFESSLGKGSTFGFRLPVRYLSTPPKETVITE